MVRGAVLSDEAWARLQPLLPTAEGRRGRPWRDHRLILEAIAWRFRTGSPWRDLPAEFGPWQTAWQLLTRWTRDGTWERLLRAVQAEGDAAHELDWVASVDSSVVRAHQHAAGARKPAVVTGGLCRMTRIRANRVIMLWGVHVVD